MRCSLVAAISAAACSVKQGDRACVSGTLGVGLRIHSSNSTSSPQVGLAPEGEAFDVSDEPSKNWAYVSGSTSGYVSCDYVVPCGSGSAQWNRYGIGLVSEGNAQLLDKARDLAGPGGWVLLVLAGVTDQTTGPQQSWVDAVQGAHDRGLNVVVRLGQPWGDSWRGMTDDSTLRSYHALGAALAAVVKGLPRPSGKQLFVQVGNEVNLGYEFFCKSASDPLPMAEVAAEYASLLRDTMDALDGLKDPDIRVAAAPMAPGGLLTYGCCGSQNCPGDAPGALGTQFLSAMEQAVPGIWGRVHWLATHSYPASKPGGCFNVPVDQALPGLKYFESELQVLQRSVQVLVTETGWASHRDGLPTCSEDDKASWTTTAYSTLWGTDSRIQGVMPFMMADAVWGDQDGYGYVKGDLSAVYPIYDAVKQQRSGLFPGGVSLV